MSASSHNRLKPRTIRIRKRSVRFGNPSLGTYRGRVYTTDNTDDTAAGSGSLHGGDEHGNDDDDPRVHHRQHHLVSSSTPLNGDPMDRKRLALHSSLQSRPLVEGAVPTENLVAMVGVPPEQVPEGVLNLVRSHRPWIHHVRILIEDDGVVEDDEGGGAEVDPDGDDDSLHYHPSSTAAAPARAGNTAYSDYHERETLGLDERERRTSYLSPTAAAVESAASILAAEQQQDREGTEAADAAEQRGRRDDCGGEEPQQQRVLSRANSSLRQTSSSLPQPTTTSRTYLILFEMNDEDAADQLVHLLHAQPYTCLDEQDVCSLHRAVAIQGEDGVSILSPFFAAPQSPVTATAAKASPRASSDGVVGDAPFKSVGSTEDANRSSSFDELDARNGKPARNSSSTSATATSSSVADTASSSSSRHRLPSTGGAAPEDYNCAVCLERLDWDHLGTNGSSGGGGAGEKSSILTTVCNHSFHLDCLLQWQDSPCPVCRYDHSGLNDALSQCHVCGTTDHNFVCLICGVVSCGGGGAAGGGPAPPAEQQPQQQPPRNLVAQPSVSHARQHYDEHLHAYALDTETQHVWDFAGGGYVHRLLQNKSDGKLVEVNDPSNTTSRERSLAPGLSDAQEGEVVHRKLEGFASQYYTLLKSQLEQQRIYYEGRLEEVRREHSQADRPRKQTSDLITALKHERNQLSQRLATLKGRRDKVRDDVSFLKNMTESLEENKRALRQQLQEAQRNRVDLRLVFESMLPPLQQKVTALMLQLEGQDLDAKPPAV